MGKNAKEKELQPKMSVDEAEAFRSFAWFKKIKSLPAGAGFEEQPIDAIEMLELEPEAAGEPAELTDIGKPFEEWDLDDQYDAYSLPLIGKKAQIHGLDSKSRFNGMIVKLEHWNRANQYFEARLDKTQAKIKVGIENVKVPEDGDTYKDPREDLQIGRDEEI